MNKTRLTPIRSGLLAGGLIVLLVGWDTPVFKERVEKEALQEFDPRLHEYQFPKTCKLVPSKADPTGSLTFDLEACGFMPLETGAAGAEVVGDEIPPSTTVQVCRGPLPSLSLRDNAEDGCVHFDIGATDPAKPDHLEKGGKDSFRHVYYVSGDQSCVGTGVPLTSGRDCDSDSDAGSGQCAYIAEGWDLYAVTGQTCSEAGVSACQGPFCK